MRRNRARPLRGARVAALMVGAVVVPILTAASPAWASPSNDAFADAETITGLPATFTGDTTGATLEAGEPQPSCAATGATVWYRFAPATATAVIAKTFGSKFDTVLAVYEGTTLGDVTEVVCNDDAEELGSLQSSVNFVGRAGRTYFVQVGGYSSASGALKLNVSGDPRPLNDAFASALALGSLPFTGSFDNSNATVEDGEPAPCEFLTVDKSLWFSYTASADRAVSVQFDYGIHPVTSVYAGDNIANLVEVVCNHEGADFYEMTFRATAGETYYIQVGVHPGDTGAPFTLSLSEAALPPNDAFAEASPLTFLRHTQSTNGAGLEPNEPQCTYVGSTVWFKHTASGTFPLTVSTRGSDFDTVVAVYRGGPDLGALEELSCNDQVALFWNDSMAGFVAEAGETYWIQVGGWFGDTGNLEVQLMLGAATDAYAEVAAVGVGAGSNGERTEVNAGAGVFPGVGGGASVKEDLSSEDEARACVDAFLIGSCFG